MNEKILVVMPVYNSEATVGQAISSIINQSFKDLILIIVDDCSTDKTMDILKSFRDPRITVYRNKRNMGAYYCRNFGLYQGRSEDWTHFTTHDADDISITSRYERMIREFRKSINVSGVQDTFVKKSLKTKRQLGKVLTMAHAMFTRDAVKNLGYFDQVRFGADWEYWERLKLYNISKGCHIRSIRTVMGYAFIHDKNLTTLISINGEERKEYVDKVKKELASNKRKMYKRFYREPGLTRKVSK